MSTTDASPDALTRVADVLWPADPPAGNLLRVARSRAVEPGSERYAAVPSLRRPRFLLPLDAPPWVRARLLLHYNHLRTDRRRAERLAIAALAGVGLPRPRAGRGLLVAAPGPRPGLREVVAEAMGVAAGDLVLAVGVRPGTGPLTPTVTVVDRTGRPCVFLKVADDPGTRAELQSEHDALAGLTQPPGSGLLVPGPLFRLEWEGALVVGIEPLPLDVRRVGPEELDATLPYLERLVAARERRDLALASSPWVSRMRGTLADLPGRWSAPLAAAVDRVVERHAPPVPHGLRHGDWSSWNMAWSASAGGLAVWDWEYSEPLAPLGLDRCNWHFAYDTSVRGLSPTQAAERLRATTHRDPLVEELFLLDMAVRRADLGADGDRTSAEHAEQLLALLSARR